MDDGNLLLECSDRLFAEVFDDEAIRRSRTGEWLETAWQRLEDMGLLMALVPNGLAGLN
jgi:hypothetical protein